ncbi:MAG: hypothetical protein WDW36_006812 [Sanguina aurantia]
MRCVSRQSTRSHVAHSSLTGSGVISGTSIAEGTRVRIIKNITIFHAPKAAASLQIEGMEGVMVKNVQLYKEQTVSATLPYKVELMPIGLEGKPVKVLVHMGEDEIEVVA